MRKLIFIFILLTTTRLFGAVDIFPYVEGIIKNNYDQDIILKGHTCHKSIITNLKKNVEIDLIHEIGYANETNARKMLHCINSGRLNIYDVNNNLIASNIQLQNYYIKKNFWVNYICCCLPWFFNPAYWKNRSGKVIFLLKNE